MSRRKTNVPVALPRIIDRSVIKRFVHKLCIVGPGSVEGCWLWTGCVMASNGYGKFKYKGRVVLAHRMSYAIYRGPVPAGMTVNHTFKPKGCNAPFPRDCNPDNLELLSHAANVAEGNERGGYRGVVKKIMLQRVENAEIDVFMCPRCNGSMVARQGHIFICLNCDHKLKESEVRTEDIIPF